MSENPQPLVSVVTPVYNGEKYIRQCIESVLAQSYENWEFIIANNCSTDRTFEIVSSYAEGNSKIKVCNNEQLLNALQNHNQALKRISSESKYCKLVHADDWLFPNCIEMMVSLAMANPSVGIVGSYGLVGDRVVGDGIPYETEVVAGAELARLALLGRILPFYSPSSLLFRSDLVRQRAPFYDEESIHADHKACYEMLRECDYGFVHQVLTYVRKHSDSVTSSVASPLDMHRVMKLDLFVQYGRDFLSQDEFEERLQRLFAQYYRLMARRFIESREAGYWEYHRKHLERLGYRFDRLRVLLGLIREFVRYPAWAIKSIFNRKDH